MRKRKRYFFYAFLILSALLGAASWIALSYFREFKEKNHIEYAAFDLSFSGAFSLKRLSWDVDSISSGQLDSLHLEVSIRKLLSGKIAIRELYLSDGKILIAQPKPRAPGKKLRLELDKLTIREVGIQYGNHEFETEWFMPYVSLRGLKLDDRIHLGSFHADGLVGEIRLPDGELQAEKKPEGLPSLTDIPFFSFDTIQFSELDIRLQTASAIHSGNLNILLTNWLKEEDFHFGMDTLYGKYGEDFNFQVHVEPSDWTSADGIAVPGAAFRTGPSVLNLGMLAIKQSDEFSISATVDESYVAFETIEKFYHELGDVIHQELISEHGFRFYGNAEMKGELLSLDTLHFNLAERIPGYVSLTVSPSDSLKGFDLRMLELETTTADLHAIFLAVPDITQLRAHEKWNLHASASGNIAGVQADGRLRSAAGTLNLVASSNGMEQGRATFSAAMRSQNLKPPLILSAADFPVHQVKFDLVIHGSKTAHQLNEFDASVNIPFVLLKGQEITNIELTAHSDGNATRADLELRDAFAELSARATIFNEDTLRIEWESEISCVQPSGFMDQMADWFYEGDLNGTLRSSGTYLAATLNQPEAAKLADADTVLALGSFSGEFTKSGEVIDLLMKGTSGQDFIDFHAQRLPNVAKSPKWRDVLDSLPEFYLVFKAEMDSTLGKVLMNKPAEFHVDKLEITKSANGHITALGAIPALAMGRRSVREAGFDLTYRDRYIRGFINVNEIWLGSEPITNTSIELTDHSGYVIYSLKSDGTKSTGPTQLAIRQTDSPQYTELTIEGDGLTLLGEEWKALSRDSILFDRNWHLLSGLVELKNNAAYLRLTKTASNQYLIGVDSVDLGYLLSAFTDKNDLTGSLNGQVILNNKADSVSLMFRTENLRWKNNLMDQISLHGTYLDDEVRFRMDALSDQSVSWLEGSYHDKLHYQGGFQNFRIAWLSNFLPDGFEINGALAGHFKGAYPPEDDDGGIIYFDRTAITSPFHLGSIQISENPITLSKGKVYAQQFGLVDAYGHTLELTGYLQFSPEVKYKANLVSDQFTMMDTDKDGQYTGYLTASAHLDIQGDKRGGLVSGNAEILPGGWLQIIQSNEGFTVEQENEIVVFRSFADEDLPEIEESKENDFQGAVDVDLNIGSTEFEMVLDPIKRTFVKFQSTGQLAINKDPGQDLSLSGRIYSSGGKAVMGLPIVPSLNMSIDEVVVSWSGDPALPLISFKGSEVFKTSLDGVPGFENRQGSVLVKLLITLDEVKPDNIAFNLGLETTDPELQQFFKNQPAENITNYATNLILLGKLTPAGEKGYNMAFKNATKKLNELSQRNLKYTDLIFTVEQGLGTEDNGQEFNQTRLNYSLQRDLINNRLHIQIDGDVGLVSEGSNEPPSSHFIGGFNLSYRLAETSPWSSEASRRIRYAGVIDGEITQYKFGFRYGKSYPTIGDLFRKSDKLPGAIDEK